LSTILLYASKNHVLALELKQSSCVFRVKQLMDLVIIKSIFLSFAVLNHFLELLTPFDVSSRSPSAAYMLEKS